MSDGMNISENLSLALDMARQGHDGVGIYGFGVVEVFGPDGELKSQTPFHNIVTDTGDAYYAAKAIAAVAPANAAAPTALTGMQIGSGGATAATKSGPGAAMVTLLAGAAFDATYPQTQNLGAGLGVNAVYRTTYAAGTGTGTVNEVTLTNGVVGTASTAANTISRVVLGTAVTKGSGDSLAVTYSTKFLG